MSQVITEGTNGEGPSNTSSKKQEPERVGVGTEDPQHSSLPRQGRLLLPQGVQATTTGQPLPPVQLAWQGASGSGAPGAHECVCQSAHAHM